MNELLVQSGEEQVAHASAGQWYRDHISFWKTPQQQFQYGGHSETGVELMANLSENTRRRIVLPGRVSPVLTLNFVRESREKTRIGGKILSENLLREK